MLDFSHPPSPECRCPRQRGVRAFVVRRNVGHVAARLTLDFLDRTHSALFGLLCIEDRTLRRIGGGELSRSELYIVETPDERLPGTSVGPGERLVSVARVDGEPVELRCGGFRVRLGGLRVVEVGA